jgi:hypothetical protein
MNYLSYFFIQFCHTSRDATETKWKPNKNRIGGVDCLAGQGNIEDALSPALATATETCNGNMRRKQLKGGSL